MSTPKTTIALVHGAFAESASWNPVIERLHRPGTVLVAGHSSDSLDVVAIANPLRSVSEDAAYVRDVLRSIDGPVVLVGHSYGGIVITEAAADSDRVAALVYVAAFAPEHGESALALSTMFPGSTLADALTAYPLAAGGQELAIRQDRFHHQFAADVPDAEARLMAVTQRPVTQAALAEGLPSVAPAWKRLPSWFVYGDEDRNIPTALHRFVAQRAGARRTAEIAGASHALSVSQPDAVAATILDAVTAVAPVPAAASGRR